MNSEYVYKTVAEKNGLSVSMVKRIYKSVWEYIKETANREDSVNYDDLNTTFRLNSLGWFYMPKKKFKWRKTREK